MPPLFSLTLALESWETWEIRDSYPDRMMEHSASWSARAMAK